MEIVYGNRVWKLCMDIVYGNSVWKLCMEIVYGNFVWKLCMEIVHGNVVWKFCMEVVLEFYGPGKRLPEVGGTGRPGLGEPPGPCSITAVLRSRVKPFRQA